MARIARKSDGRRIFTAEFKQAQIGRVLSGELTVAELSRKLGVAPSLLQRWKRSTPQGAEIARVADGPLAPVSKLGAEQYIRELQLLVGKQAVELELIRAELVAFKRRMGARGAPRP